MEFYLDEPNQLWIEELKAYIPKRGIGSALLRELTKDFGANIGVSCAVIHTPTKTFLRKHGVGQQPEQHLQLNNESVPYYAQIPIVKIFNSGNIRLERLDVGYTRSPRKHNSRWLITAFGKTV
jgi:hypothetical protein